ncbi:hypothetical protein WCE39_07900 [Luteimonas sp. MJ174]|uniref:hypothetical protein n=1 Tax=Luteimonas sp. MJ174 TaxID=3129237 RepID=UPI0031BAED65
MMRDELKEAIQALSAGQRFEHWYGKTYRQFWDWFDAEDARILAMAAGGAELEAVRGALLDIRADTGRDVPDERADDVIEQARGRHPTRAELDTRIADLRAQMTEILAMEEKDQMDAFAGVADEVLEDARLEDQEHVWSQLQCILRDTGLVPGDDEPCTEA